MALRLDIIIVNWNSGQLLRDCVDSIVSVKKDGFILDRVVVIDNASSDHSLDGLDTINLPLTIIRNRGNKGFGVACNQGAASSDADYLLFLNPDTRLFDNSLTVPLAFMQDKRNQNVGICGIQLVDDKGRVAKTCAHFPSLSRFAIQSVGLNKLLAMKGAGVHMSEWDHQSERQVDHVIGAFFFMRKTVFEALNGFDQRFFVYLEDVDVSLRAKQAGWETSYLTDSQAFHEGGGTSSQIKATRLFYSLRSRLMYGFKHFPVWKAWLLVFIIIVLEPVSRTVFALLRGSWLDMLNTWGGYYLLYINLHTILVRERND